MQAAASSVQWDRDSRPAQPISRLNCAKHKVVGLKRKKNLLKKGGTLRPVAGGGGL